jgi:hypothetical protein
MTKTTQDLTLKLSLEEVNLVLEGLGNLPFARVFGLIGRIQEQASAQLTTAPVADESPSAPLAMVASR